MTGTVLILSITEWQNYWPDASALLEPAFKLSSGRHTVGSTAKLLASGEYVLLVAIVNEKMKSACICSVTQYPAAKWLTMVLCAGDDMPEWLENGREALEKLSKIHGCVGIEVIGRLGWRKVLDLQPLGFWMERRL